MQNEQNNVNISILFVACKCLYTQKQRATRESLERYKKVINICKVENETRMGERAQYTEINEDEWKKKQQ